MTDYVGPNPPCDPSRRVVFVYDPAADEPLHGSPYLTTPPPGRWYYSVNDKVEKIPTITCPRCGHHGCLGNHTIDADGTVNPSIVCPMASCGDGVARCDAHYYGRLDGYKENKK